MTSEEKGFVGFYKISGILHLNCVKVLFGGEIYIREGRIGEKRGRQMEIQNRKRRKTRKTMDSCMCVEINDFQWFYAAKDAGRLPFGMHWSLQVSGY